MKQNEVKLAWDGEKIKQEVKVPEIKISPKDMLDSLDNARNQLSQMIQQKSQLEDNFKAMEKNIKSAEAFIKERIVFEEKCIEIQVSKLDHYINQMYDECKKSAEEQAKKTIAQSPDAYTDNQKENMKFVNFQRLLATNGKIAENISKKLIAKHLFENPRFTNPFKGE